MSAGAPLALAWRAPQRRALLLLAASLLAAAPARAEAAMPAAAPGLPFAGVAIGDPLAKLEPHFHTADTGEPTCHRDSGVIGHLTCQYVGARDAAGILWFGDVPYKVLAFDYFKERLVGFRLWTGVENYPALAARLAKLYGAPRSADSSTIYDSRGRPLDQVIAMWKTGAGVLELDKRSWSVDQSRLSLIAVSGQTEIITNGGSVEPLSPDSGTQGAGQGGSGNGGAGAGGAFGGGGLGGLGQPPGPGGLLSSPDADRPR